MPISPKARAAMKILGALLLGSGAAVWLARDLPRQWVEVLLAEQLGADVELDRLSFEARDRFLLEGLRIGPSRALPQLAAAEVGSLRIRGRIGQLLEGEVASVEVDGALLRLRPAALPPPPETPPRFHRVSLRGVQLWFQGSGPLWLEGSLSDLGGPATGAELELRAARLDLPPVAAVAALGGWEPPPELSGTLSRLEGDLKRYPGSLEASLRLGRLEGGRGELQSSAEDLGLEVSSGSGTTLAVLSGGTLVIPSPSGPQTLKGARLTLGISPGDGGAQLAASAELQLQGETLGSLRGALDPRTYRPQRVDGSLEAVPLPLLLPWLPAAGGAWSGEGSLGLVLETPEASPSAATPPAHPFPIRFRVQLDAPRLHLTSGGAELRAGKVRGEVTGRLDPARLAPRGAVEGEIRIASLEGDLKGRPLPPGLSPLAGRFALRSSESGLLGLPAGTVSLTAGGAGRLELDLPAPGAGGKLPWSWRWTEARGRELVTLLAQAGVGLPPELELDGRLRGLGTARWDGSLPAPETLQAEGRLFLEEGRAAGADPGAWRLGELRGEVRWRWRGGRLEAETHNFEGELTAEPLAPLPLRGEAALELDPAAAAIEVRKLGLSLPELLDLEGEGSWRAGQGRARLRFQGVELAAWRHRLRPLTGELAPGLTVSGSVSGELDAELRAEQEGGSGAHRWSLKGPLRVEGGGFASEDGSHVLEGLSSRWQVHLRSAGQVPDGEAGGGAPAVARLEARAEVSGFQILLGTFFADFSDLATELSLDAVLGEAAEPGSPRELRSGLRWQVEEGSGLSAGVVAEAGRLHTTVEVSLEDLEGLLDRHLRPPLLDASARFEDLRARGALRFRAGASRAGDGALEVRGQLLADGFSLAGLGSARLQDLRLDLPFHLLQPAGRGWQAGDALAGSLSFRGLEVEGLALDAAEAPLLIRGDSVSLKRPLVLPLAGGRWVFEGLTLVDLLGAGRHLETALELDGLELERLSADLGLPPLEGRIDGRLPRIRLDGRSLEVDGGGEVQVFGGTVSVGDISGQDVLSRYPKVVFSARFRELDLGRITRRFDVGEMSGVLEGSLEDCELFRAVLVRCSGRFQTVERPGVKRTISVKAVNNIAILGTGQGAGFLDRGITRFFDRYTYSRLGIEMRLDRDVFLLRGLEERRGKELFLKGRLPFPIDVVNAQPGRTVSFQTMLRRLKALDFGSAVTER